MAKGKGPTQAQIVAAARSKLDSLAKEMQSLAAPSKRQNKRHGRASTPIWQQNLQGVPGGGILKMAEAKETGTKLAGPSIQARLQRSPQNSFTTRGNYII